MKSTLAFIFRGKIFQILAIVSLSVTIGNTQVVTSMAEFSATLDTMEVEISKRKYKSAAKYLDVCTTYFEAEKANMPRLWPIRFLLSASNIYNNQMNCTKATTIAKEAFVFIEQSNDTAIMKQYLPLIFYRLGSSYRMNYQMDSAIYYADLAHHLYKKWPELQTGRKFANLQVLFGNIYSDRGEAQKSIDFQSLALKYYKENQLYQYQSIMLDNIGLEHMKLENWNEAEKSFFEAIKVLKLDSTSTPKNTLEIYSNLQNVYTNSVNKKGLALLDTIHQFLNQHPELKENCEPYILGAKFLTRMNKDIEADSFFRIGLQLAQKSNFNSISSLNIFDDYSVGLFKQQQYDQAMYVNELALNKLDGFPLISYTLLAQALARKAFLLAHFYRNNKDNSLIDSVLTLTDRAIDLSFENVSQYRKVTSIELPIKRKNYTLEVLNQVFALLYEETGNAEYLRRIFVTNETFKSIKLRSHLKQDHIAELTSVPKEIIETELNLINALNRLEEEKQQLIDTSAAYYSNLKQTTVVNEQLDQLYNQLNTEFPDYFKLMYSVKNDNLANIQQNINPDETMIVYAYSRDHVFAMVNNTDRTDFFVLDSSIIIDDLIAKMHYGITGYYTSSEQSDDLQTTTLKTYVSSASKLYDLLIKPFHSFLKQKLIIVPSGELNTISFNALLEERPKRISYLNTYKYLVNKYQISYSYSASLYDEMRENAVKKTNFSCRWAGFAPYANHNATDNALPYSGKEVESIGKLMQGNSYADQAATIEIFNACTNNCEMVHLSTHTKITDQMGSSSWLYFANESKMYLRDIYTKKIKTRVIYLSACESTIGDKNVLEGFLGLSRAFAYAGTPCLVATLWKINDSHTSLLNQDFYQFLAEKKTVSQSLSLAQRKFLKNNSSFNAHPYFWAGIISIGYADYQLMH
jgi:CHAT domain-containing protein